MRVFNEIHFQNLRGDLFGGVTAAVIALPMALAFGVASGAGAEAGLYGAVLVGLFAALFGGTPTLISEPTGPMTVVMTAVIASLIAADPENGLAMAFTTVMMAGLFQILFGFLRLGRYVTLMPYIVISGFMSGIGLILIILQLAPLLGHAAPPGGVLGALQGLPELAARVQPQELALGVLSLAILLFMPARARRIVPPQLLALVVGTLLSVLLLAEADIRRIGEIPGGLPSLQLPVFTAAQWQSMVVDALVLGMLGSIDALLSAVIADSLTRRQHDSDKELVGQGLGNFFSGLFGGLPGAGATMGTVVNIQTGARSALSGLTRALILAVVVLWASGLTAHIPLAVLAGIAVKVGIDIIDWAFIRRAHRVSLRGAAIMYGVIVLTVFADLIIAVGIGLFIANVLTVKRLADLQEENVCTLGGGPDAATPGCVRLAPREQALLEGAEGGVRLLHMTGPLIFGVAKAITRQGPLLQGARTLVLDMTLVNHLGVTTALAIETTIRDARERGAAVYLVGVAGQPRERLERLGVRGSLVPAENWLAERADALRRAVRAAEGDGVTAPA